MYLGVRCRK
uniref:Glycosyltransferase QUASIMODO1, putative n=1 Tax=Arundo donax TaxID=35708 RepID=A0A0A9GY27_ARUDO